MDRTSKVQTAAPSATSDRYSTYSYDRTGNIVNTLQDATEGTTVTPGRNFHYDFDPANWLKDQCTLATLPTPVTCNAPTSASDQRVLNSFTPLGLEQQREVDAANGATWAAKETSTWTYYLNGKLQQLNIYNGPNDGVRNPVEAHSVKYTTNPADVTSTYMNGNRTQDVFTLAAATNTTGAPCTAYPATCTASYLYDPRDRLVQENNGHQTTTTYNNQVNGVWYPGLDASGNVSQESISTGTTKQYSYTGNQLQSITSTLNGVSSTQNYWYTDDGNLWCTTTPAGSRANCPLSAQATPPSTLVSAYTYDYLSRLSSYRAFSGGTQTDCANYVYDALDRLLTETETHSGTTCNAKTTQFTYLAATSQMTEEQQSVGGTLQATKDYSYDVYGKRLSETMTPSGGASTTYTYGYNVHGSVSMLLDPSGGVKATYGYRPYGDPDTGLTLGDSDPNNPTNAFRYSAKRFDSGSKSIDTGARRFSTDTMRFLQPDQLNGAFGDMQLSTDPLSQNRYSLAAGNPLGLTEWDGHMPIADGGGSGAAAATPTVNVDVCVHQQTCNANDFQAMTIEQRMQFITGIQQTYGDRYNFDNWFNAIHGVLRFANGESELRNNEWFKTVDAPILQAIQDGISIKENGKVLSKGGSGKSANEWAAFFSYRASIPQGADNNATIQRSKQLWGAAEIDGTNFGKTLAARKGLTAPVGGTLFTDVTDQWRNVMKSGPRETGSNIGSEVGNAFCGIVCGFIGGKAGEETFDRLVDPRYEDQTYTLARANWEFSKRAEPFVGPLIGAPWSWPPITLWP